MSQPTVPGEVIAITPGQKIRGSIPGAAGQGWQGGRQETPAPVFIPFTIEEFPGFEYEYIAAPPESGCGYYGLIQRVRPIVHCTPVPGEPGRYNNRLEFPPESRGHHYTSWEYHSFAGYAQRFVSGRASCKSRYCEYCEYDPDASWRKLIPGVAA